MVEECKITYMHIYGSLFTLQEEFRRTTINNYYRSVAEYSAPFQDKSSPVYQAGLRLVSIDTKVVYCPYNEKWVTEGKKGQRQLSIFLSYSFCAIRIFPLFYHACVSRSESLDRFLHFSSKLSERLCTLTLNWNIILLQYSLWHSDVIRWHRSGPTLAQVLDCILTTSSQYMHQCWFIISTVMPHSSEGNLKKHTPAINHTNYL